jgi:hypothetical protein
VTALRRAFAPVDQPDGRIGFAPETGMSWRLLCIAVLLPVLAGCRAADPCGSACEPAWRSHAGVDCPLYRTKVDCVCTTLAAKRCAWEALAASSCNRGCDFNDGFVQAYVDVFRGSNGTPPPVPPQRFWWACARTNSGQARATEWFAGYHAGASQALSCNCGTLREVPSSGTGYSRGMHQGLWSDGDGAYSGCGNFPADWQ